MGEGLTSDPAWSATFLCRAWTWASGGRTSRLCTPAHSPPRVQLPEGVRLGFMEEEWSSLPKKVGVSGLDHHPPGHEQLF